MSIVSICNSALIKIGQERISSLTEDNKRAILCNEQYDKIRKKAITAHLWNFSLARATLALTTTVPTYGHTNTFQLPADVLSVLLINDNDNIPWRVEGNLLLSDNDTMDIWYIKDITDTSLYRPYFSELLAFELAYDISYALVESSAFRRTLREDLLQERRDAYYLDAREGTPIGFSIDHLTSSRATVDMSKTTDGWY